MKYLDGKVALVAGATRGAGRGIAVELGAAGATVYVTGRTTRAQRSEYNRPETIEETAELVNRAGGCGIAVQVDHLDPVQVQALIARIENEQGRLDILVNDIWGGENLIQWQVPVWEHSLDQGFRMLRLAIDTHIITSHFALPLLIRNKNGLVVEITDGTAEYNNQNYRLSMFYDLAKSSVIRMARSLAHELAPYYCTAVAVTPGWMRSEIMLEHFGVKEENWRDATEKEPHFIISETPRYIGVLLPHWLATRKSPGGTVTRFRAASLPKCMVFMILTAHSRTVGGISKKYRMQANRRMLPVIVKIIFNPDHTSF